MMCGLGWLVLADSPGKTTLTEHHYASKVNLLPPDDWMKVFLSRRHQDPS